MRQESGTIRFGRSTISYRVKRSVRRSTIAISVDAAEGVTVIAPAETPKNKIAEIIFQKSPWILRHLADFAELGPMPLPKEFVSGEELRYLGRHYRLKVVRRINCDKPLAKLQGRYLFVTLVKDPQDKHGRPEIKDALIKWYKDHARQRLPERVAIFARKIGSLTPPVYIRDQQKRWGSCSRKGELRFNWRIIMAPRWIVDYVVAHEVCHLKVHNHSNAFWKLLRKLMPDYEQRREQLRKLGVQFHL